MYTVLLEMWTVAECKSWEITYTTGVTTLIDQRIAAPANRLGECSASRQALCYLECNYGMGLGGEQFRE